MVLMMLMHPVILLLLRLVPLFLLLPVLDPLVGLDVGVHQLVLLVLEVVLQIGLIH